MITNFHPKLLLLLLWLPLLTVNSQPADNRNITLGSFLTTASKDYWLSPSGDFAFGFQQVAEGSESFLLAIWFDRIPQRTVVWSANRNNLVPGGSTVKLTKDGSLILTDPSGRQVWNANAVGGSGVFYGALLDTGNFVLADRNSVTLWGSFDQPMDTILPTQTLPKGGVLTSKYSNTNYSTGRFKLVLQNDGNMVLYTVFYPQLGSNYAYWASATNEGNTLVFNRTGSLFLTSTNGTILSNLFNNRKSIGDFYHRVTIDSDGVIRHYIYPKSNNNNNNNASASSIWPMEWTVLDSEPSNICTKIKGSTGSGVCGFNSYCQMDDGQFPKCNCPQGYVFLDPSDKSKGCVKNFSPQNCLLDENDQFDLVEMISADFPQGDYRYLSSISEDTCREACLSDCLCDAVTFNGGSCWTKRAPLSNGNADPENGGKTLIKVRRDNSTVATSLTQKKDRSMNLIITAGWVLLGFSVFVNLLFLFASCPWGKNRLIRQVSDDPNQSTSLSTNLMSFAYREMELATGGFKQILGSGSSSTVYKGVLNRNTNCERLVAVKVLDQMPKRKGHDVREFTTEVKLISGTNHKSLVKLVGFCNEGEHCLLVYEFMSNGSLANLLFERDQLRIDWYTRTQIAYSVARGLVYLHEECSTQIIHCDIKPQNILLDGSMTARISDFGLSKLMKADQTKTMTAIRGTKGYLAPEWFRNVPITAKVDVHSFGIVLLELVCCRKNCMMEVEKEEEMVLVDWAYECYSKGKLRKLVEKDEDAMMDMGKVERFVKVAMWCIQEDPSLRPGMKKVAHMLEGAVVVSEPPDPNSFISAV